MAFAEISYGKDGDSRILVQTNWIERHMIKEVPGSRWDPSARVWYVPLSWASCVILRGIFGTSLTVGENLNKWGFQERQNRIEPAMKLRTEVEPPDVPFNEPAIEQPSSGKKLYGFQEIGAQFLVKGVDVLLGDEMGTGKTIQVLAAMESLSAVKSLPALVICPNSVKDNWAREAAIWFPDANVYILQGTQKQRNEALLKANQDLNALVIINFEATWRYSRIAPYGSIRLLRCRECDKRTGHVNVTPTRCEVHPRILNRIPFKVVVIDEAHRIKDPRSKQTRAIWALSHMKTVKYHWGLTGTPLANNPTDLWAIMHALAPIEYPSRTSFIERYTLSGWDDNGGLSVVGLNPTTKDELYKFFDPRFRRMPKSLVLSQLPPKVFQQRFVEMTPKQAVAYKEIESQYITRLADGSLITAIDLTTQIRLLQFSSSYATAEQIVDPATGLIKTHVTLTEPSPKLDEMELILEELGDQQVAICAESRQLIMLAAARLKKNRISYSMIVGGMTTYERSDALDNFQCGKNRVMLFTVKAGGTGLTMTAASTMIYLQRSWSMIDNKQSGDRIHRIGSEKHSSITFIDIVTRNTIEDRVQIPRLYEKMQRLEQIVRDRVTLTAAGVSTQHLDDEESHILSLNLGDVTMSEPKR